MKGPESVQVAHEKVAMVTSTLSVSVCVRCSGVSRLYKVLCCDGGGMLKPDSLCLQGVHTQERTEGLDISAGRDVGSGCKNVCVCQLLPK